MRDESRRANRLAAWTYVIGVAGYVLMMITGLLGLAPPKPLRPVIGMIGGGAGILAVLILLAVGWRAQVWWIYFVTAVWIIVGFALGAAALVGLWVALFDPSPPPVPPERLFHNVAGPP